MARRKIGFIDYYIDEWHANNYPRWIRESFLAGEFELAWAWAEIDKTGGMTTDAWCAKYEAGRATSLERLVADCDCLVVLSPDNPERHEELCALPAASRKPTYVDKTFAPDLATAKRIAAAFERNATPMWSSSALRFAEEFDTLARQGIRRGTAECALTRGPGTMAQYGVHQVEMLVSLLGPAFRRVMQCGPAAARHYVFEHDDGRRAMMTMSNGLPFQLSARRGEAVFHSPQLAGTFFPRFIEAMLAFFKDPAQVPVTKAETCAVIASVEAGMKADTHPDTWIEVPR